MNMKRKGWVVLIAAMLGTALSGAAWGRSERNIDSPFRWSGFVTATWQVSNSRIAYDNNIDSHGTFNPGTVMGLQGTYSFSPYTWFTSQVVIAPKDYADDGFGPAVRWAYLAHDLGNNWNVRLGRQRFNLYRNSENLEVGNTYLQATLPKEIYINPSILSADMAQVRKRFFFTETSTTEFGMAYGVKNYDSRSQNAQTRVVSYVPSELGAFNAFVTHKFGNRSTLFASLLEFDSTTTTGSRVSGNKGTFTTLGFESQWGPVSYSIESFALHSDVTLQAAPGQNTTFLGGLSAKSYAVMLAKAEGVVKPYVQYSRYSSRFNATSSQWTLRAGVAYRWRPMVVYKAEVSRSYAPQTGAGSFFDQPAGVPGSVNVLALSYNRLF